MPLSGKGCNARLCILLANIILQRYKGLIAGASLYYDVAAYSGVC